MSRELDHILGDAPKPPSIRLDDHLDDETFTAWRGLRVDVSTLYATLTELGWKIDTEESDLMHGMSKVWRDSGIKVWLWLENFVSTPPDGDIEPFDTIRFYRFDPAAMPTRTMLERLHSQGLPADLGPGRLDELRGYLDHADPQTETFDLLTPIRFRDVPRDLLEEAWLEIEEGVRLERPE